MADYRNDMNKHNDRGSSIFCAPYFKSASQLNAMECMCKVDCPYLHCHPRRFSMYDYQIKGCVLMSITHCLFMRELIYWCNIFAVKPPFVHLAINSSNYLTGTNFVDLIVCEEEGTNKSNMGNELIQLNKWPRLPFYCLGAVCTHCVFELRSIHVSDRTSDITIMYSNSICYVITALVLKKEVTVEQLNNILV